MRTLVDGENPLFEYELNIIRVVSYLELGEKVVICCRAGVSRSNAIALGVLVHYFKIDVKQALELITSGIGTNLVLKSGYQKHRCQSNQNHHSISIKCLASYHE